MSSKSNAQSADVLKGTSRQLYPATRLCDKQQSVGLTNKNPGTRHRSAAELTGERVVSSGLTKSRRRHTLRAYYFFVNCILVELEVTIIGEYCNCS